MGRWRLGRLTTNHEPRTAKNHRPMPSIDQPVGAMGSTGYLIYDVNTPGVLGPAVINSYTTLAIPPYWRAMAFLSENLASFPKSVRKDNVDVPHRLTRLLQLRPNTYQDASLFWRTLFFHWAHYRNAFAVIERDTQMQPKALHVKIPEMVAPFRLLDDDGQASSFYWVGGYKPKIYAGDDVIHLSGLSYDGIGGFNPVFVHSETLERSRLLDRYVTRFLTKGSIIRGSVEVPAGMNKDQQESIVSTIRSHFLGADADRDLLVLSGGAKFTNNGTTPRDSELVAQFSLNTKQVSQITGVPPHFLMDDAEGKYNNNPQQAADDVVRWCFRPIIENFEPQLTLKLLTIAEAEAGLSVHLDADRLVRGDAQTLSTIVVAQKNAGILSANDARKKLGEPPSSDPEADKLKTSGDTTGKGKAPENDAQTAGRGDGEKDYAQIDAALEALESIPLEPET